MGEAVSMPWAPVSELPWSKERGERTRFLIILSLVALLFVPPALLIPLIDLPEPDRNEVEKVPPALAHLLEQPKPEPKAKPKPVEPEPVVEPPEPEPEPEPAPKAETPKPEPAKAPPPKPEVPAERAPAPPEQTVQQARETASRSGLLAMKDRLAALREPEAEPAPVLRANAGKTTPAETSDKPAVSRVLAGSEGVEKTEAPTTEVAVAGHEVKAVQAKPEPVHKTVARVEPKADKGPGQRAMSNIRKVFDSQKTALYSLYRRELRQDPTLQGKVLLELVIQPDGSVSSCEVVSSELDNPTLENRIALRVRMFNFGADDVEPRTVRFPVDFLPG
ncbi:hypothetical protein MSNKSG1_06698 [Marinobacter santoriniensis NKSG1]|uniref:TonB family protein n=1 Tax=Marinobacter santoriniensis NKSG1 TaxID=1288826 RepID=M7CQT8_9GAMM|nr:AgmX/PglI C-terminal domain-containing protein [Marinobacter santoriniensis]EMP55539.1 hypothetical protein MSNKSG1_06698 [Marinobacter santoriniensis NKSG1]